jgi:hypothetical protein
MRGADRRGKYTDKLIKPISARCSSDVPAGKAYPKKMNGHKESNDER